MSTQRLYYYQLLCYIVSPFLPKYCCPSTSPNLCSALFSHKLTVHSSPLPAGLLQVQQSQEKIARLEQEKEHWLLEAQLGKVRLEKENQRIADLEAQLAAALGGSPNSQPAAAAASSTVTQSLEEVEKELKAAGKETTLCTSLVQSLHWLLYLLVLLLAEEISCPWHSCLICFNKGSIIVLLL